VFTTSLWYPWQHALVYHNTQGYHYYQSNDQWGIKCLRPGDLGSLLDLVNIKLITISVALEGSPTLYNYCITKQGLLPLLLSDGTTYYQTCFSCANMVDTIISLAVVLALSDVFYSWTQEGFKDPSLLDSICVTSHDSLLSMFFPRSCRNGLYYCNTNVYTVDQDRVHVHCQCTSAATSTTPQH
jgi:hypothetical protein